MRYAETSLPPPLDRWVECVWTAEAADSDGVLQTIVPDGCPELIVQLGDVFEAATDAGVERQPAAFVMGALPGPLRLRPTGRIRTVGVRFRPGALSAFVAMPQRELAGRATALDDVFGPSAGELVERLAGAGAATVADVAGAFLRSRLRPRGSGRVLAAELVRARGRVGVDALARAAGVTARQVERIFGDQVGLSPKRLARVVRLQEVLRRMAASPARWVDVALECGYADQAHLSRDFRELAGESPGRWTAGELARQFTAPERLDAFFAG